MNQDAYNRLYNWLLDHAPQVLEDERSVAAAYERIGREWKRLTAFKHRFEAGEFRIAAQPEGAPQQVVDAIEERSTESEQY